MIPLPRTCHGLGGFGAGLAWKRKLRDAGGAADPADPASGFVEARVRGVDDGHGVGLIIQLVDGRRILVGRGFDRGLLREVLQALESGAGGGP